MPEESNISDEGLILQYQAGREEALVELVKRWHKAFCKKAYWIVKDEDLAKDVAQDSWRHIITKINDLKDPNRFVPWSMRIVYNKSLDTLNSISKNGIRKEKYVKDNKSEAVEFKEDDSLSRISSSLVRSLAIIFFLSIAEIQK